MFEEKQAEVMAPEAKTGSKSGFNRRDFLSLAAMMTAGAGVVAGLEGCAGESSISSSTSLSSWQFGIMGDTQWLASDDGKNPYSSAIEIIRQINSAFINNGVKFVIHVGDLCNDGYSTSAADAVEGEQVRAIFAQQLYNAGIAFFPLRGNHDDTARQATNFQSYYPQTQGGNQNATPSSVFALSNPDTSTQPYPTQEGASFKLGSNFSSPDPWSTGNLKGLSYSFDYAGSRFVLLDQFTPTDSNSSYSINTTIGAQQSWISTQLAGKPSGGHAFVFAHKGLLTEDHQDVLFGSNPAQNPTLTDAFIKSLANNGVQLYFCGHDHMHDRSLVYTTDGATAKVMQQVCQSDSSKFYTPYSTANDVTFNYPAFGVYRQVPVRQELYKVGYYLVTVEGNNITVDYYAADVNATTTATGQAPEYLVSTIPTLNFTLRESYGYSLIGKQFQIKPGASFTSITDSSSLAHATVAKVLAGTNLSISTDYSSRSLVRVVNTGWTSGSGAISDVFYLWGMQSAIGSEQCETYVLQLSFATTKITAEQIVSGNFGLATLDSNGKWSNAVNGNYGGSKSFVKGAWNSSYTLGTYGVDPVSGVAWAVINYGGKFAVANNI